MAYLDLSAGGPNIARRTKVFKPKCFLREKDVGWELWPFRCSPEARKVPNFPCVKRFVTCIAPKCLIQRSYIRSVLVCENHMVLGRKSPPELSLKKRHLLITNFRGGKDVTLEVIDAVNAEASAAT